MHHLYPSRVQSPLFSLQLKCRYYATSPGPPPELLVTSSDPVQISPGGRHYYGVTSPSLPCARYCARGASCRWIQRVARPDTNRLFSVPDPKMVFLADAPTDSIGTAPSVTGTLLFSLAALYVCCSFPSLCPPPVCALDQILPSHAFAIIHKHSTPSACSSTAALSAPLPGPRSPATFSPPRVP